MTEPADTNAKSLEKFDENRPRPVPAIGTQDGATLPRLVGVMQRLLADDGCPWDREQTLESLRKYVLEEACEVIDAIEGGNRSELREELGDLMLQIVFQAELARRENAFAIDDVVSGIVDKLDEAKRLDPAGDTRPAVKQARDNADNATRLAPAPSAAPTTMNAPPAPSSSAPDLSKPSPKPHPSPSAFSTETPTPAPTITTPPAIMKPTKSIGNSDSDFVQGKESMAPLKKAPAKKTATPDFGS